MKKNLIFVLLFACIAPLVCAQQQQTSQDSAAAIIKRYYSILKYNYLKRDSILYIESKIVHSSTPNDTLVMRRWFLPRFLSRIEFWYNGQQEVSYHSDGRDIFRKFDTVARAWMNISREQYFDEALAYHYQGALHDWETKGCELEYVGEGTYEGHPIEIIKTFCPNNYDRQYYFEKETGLLFQLDEYPLIMGEKVSRSDSRVEWRAIHEYQPLGMFLFPSIESYLHQGELTIQYHHYQFIPLSKTVFIADWPK